MNSIEDIQSIPAHWRCEHCNGAGETIDLQTVMGAGFLLEAGKAYVDTNRRICPYCRGSGMRPS